MDSPDYMGDHERFNKDFATVEREERARAKERRERNLERRRVETFDRDLKRWEFMEQQQESADRMDQVRRDKYQIGRKGAGSNAYNLLNYNYEPSQRG
jgi:HD superfamily phosphohydrolase